MEGDCILEPSSEAIFSKLLPKYLECQLRQAIFESLTAEYAARRVAMIAASENAEEIIDELTQVYNKARQEAITKELLEVVSGIRGNGRLIVDRPFFMLVLLNIRSQLIKRSKLILSDNMKINDNSIVRKER